MSKSMKEHTEEVERHIKEGTMFASLIAIKPKSPCGLFVYLFCAEMDRLEFSDGVLTSLKTPEIDKIKIRAYRWDLITVDMIHSLLSRNVKSISSADIKHRLSKKYPDRLKELYPNCKNPELSLHDMVMACPLEDVPDLLSFFMKNFIPDKKLPSAA